MFGPWNAVFADVEVGLSVFGLFGLIHNLFRSFMNVRLKGRIVYLRLRREQRQFML